MAARLDDGDDRRDDGAFFGSVHGTLDHLLVADRIWLHRLTGTGERPDRLDAILFDDLAALRDARTREDERLVGYVAGLSAGDLDGEVAYATLDGTPQRQARGAALVHVFNHQTHHHGQAHALLTRLGITRPDPLDLLIMQRERAAAPG